MAKRQNDEVIVEAVGLGEFDAFTSLQITHDLTTPSEAAFEIGDDGTWDALEHFIAMGSEYKVKVNGRLVMTGRVELQNVAGDVGGSTVRMTVRTRLADAMFASADMRLSAPNITLADWLVKLYEPLGYTRADFVFKGNTARDLITGKPSRATKEPLRKPDQITQDRAKPQPGESIFQAADRHLRRFGLMHWDSPDGKIVVSAPDDEQEPQYYFNHFRGAAGADNNVLGIERTRDFSGVPSKVSVRSTHVIEKERELVAAGPDGSGGITIISKEVRTVVGEAEDPDVAAAGFHRPINVHSNQFKRQDLVDAAAHRELSARSQRKEAFDVSVDGLSYWDGNRLINFAPDTVAVVNAATAGGRHALYYVTRTQLERNPSSGDTARITMLKQGIWKLS